MGPALARGIAEMGKRVTVPELPSWLYSLDFAHAWVAADPWIVGELVQQLRRAEGELRMRAAAIRCIFLGQLGRW